MHVKIADGQYPEKMKQISATEDETDMPKHVL